MRGTGLWRCILLGAATLGSLAAAAQDFPSRPVAIVVGNPAGGPTDIAARLLADRLSPRFNQPVVVENRPGANTIAAINHIMASPPDGHRVMIMASGVTFLSVVDKSVKIDFANDIEPVGIVMTGDYVYYAPLNAPYKTMEELIAWLKANPGKGNYANASGDLVSITLFRKMTETQFEVIRYNGAPRAVQAVTAAEASFSGGVPVSTVKALYDAGKLRLLAMAGPQRSPLVPEIPALGESKSEALRAMSQFGAFSGYWLSVIAPKGTPAPVVARWNAALKEVLAEAEVRNRVLAMGMVPMLTTPSEMRNRIATDVPRWTKVARDNGIQAE